MSQPTSAPPQLSNMNHMFAPSPHHHHPHHHHHHHQSHDNNNSNNANSSSNGSNGSSRAINNNTTSINVVGTSSSRALPGILDENSNNNNRPTISAYNPMTKNQFLQHVIHNHIQQVKVALDHQPDLIHAKTTDHFHYTALHRASQLGFIEIVDLLLNKGADINELSDRVSWRACLLAAKHGHVHVVKSLLDAGEDVNVQLAYTKNRFTCLHFAAQYGHSDLARMLLQDYKARIDIVSANGLRPIHTAANFGNFEIVDLILAAGENINERHNSPWKYTPLHWAVQENKTNTVELLLKRGADVNSVTGNTNLTPLIQSATKNFPDIARLLLAYGADYRIANKHGLRAVHIAASSNSVETLRVILDHASPSELYALAKSNARECDPLRFAITAKAKDCVLELINRGVNTNGVLEWMEEWDLISKNPCPILEIIRNHEASIVYRRGIVMQNCAATKKFVDIEIITQTM